MKINQYCSVCKKHLDMEVIPTDDGGDDGVIWLRCPECQGFLPKFTGGGGGAGGAGESDRESGREAAREPADQVEAPATDPAAGAGADTGPAVDRTPAADVAVGPDGGAVADLGLPPVEPDSLADGGESAAAVPPPDAAEPAAAEDTEGEASEPAEPVAEYAARLAEADPSTARPYRPTDTYAEGDLLHHLAYDDLGIVVAKETLPGGRRAVKVFFEEAGVVRLIEQAGGR